jgi:hypothetical protein
MWYRKSVRDELIERILDKLPNSVRSEQGVERYVHDFAYDLKLENVKPGDERLVKSGIEYVNMKINQSRNK